MLINGYASLNNQVQEQDLFPIWVMMLGIQMTHHVKLINCGLVNFVLYAIVNFVGLLEIEITRTQYKCHVCSYQVIFNFWMSANSPKDFNISISCESGKKKKKS